MASVKVVSSTKWQMQPLPALNVAALMPRLDVAGMTGAIEHLWAAFSAQQQLTSELAATLNKHKEDSEHEMKDMRDHLYGLINGLRDELHKQREENRELNSAMKDLIKASERECKRATEEAKEMLEARVNGVQEQVTHSAHVANTALDRALDAVKVGAENQQRISDVEDSVCNDLNRLQRTLGLSKADCRRACDNETTLDTFLGTPALSHILGLIGNGAGSGGGSSTMSQDEKDLLGELKGRMERLEGKHSDLAAELRGADRHLATRIDKLESALKALEAASTKLSDLPPISSSSSSGSIGAEAADALNLALSKMRNEIAQLRSGLEHVARELHAKADADLLDKLADAHASIAQRVATLEGTLNDTRSNVDEALRLARLALRNQQQQQQGGGNGAAGQGGHHKKSSDADATAIMMLRDALDGLTGRVVNLEREVNDVDARKAGRDELNRSLQDVLKAMEQAIAQLYDELKRQLASLPFGGGATGDGDAADATSGRFRCLSCNRKAGPLQDRYHERMSKPMLPPSDTIVGGSPGGISPPRNSPPRGAPPVPGVRDGFEPRPLTGSRRKLQTYYDWLGQKTASSNYHDGGGGAPSNSGSNLNNGLVGKTFTRGGVNQQQQQTSNPQPPTVANTAAPSGSSVVVVDSHYIQQHGAHTAHNQQHAADTIMTSARVALAEMPPTRTESPNPATTVGADGRHYVGVVARNQASQLPRGVLPASSGRPQSPRVPPAPASGASTPAGAVLGGAPSARPGTAASARRHV